MAMESGPDLSAHDTAVMEDIDRESKERAEEEDKEDAQKEESSPHGARYEPYVGAMCPARPDLRPILLGPSSGRAGLSTDSIPVQVKYRLSSSTGSS